MKHWNYRVIEFPADQDEPARRELREVYYDDSGRPCAYGAPALVMWDDEEDPATPYSILQRMREALNKPVLDALNFVEERPSPQTEMASFTVALEKDPDSNDLLLPFPATFLADQDWRVGDRVNFEVQAEGRYVVTNLSKAARES